MEETLKSSSMLHPPLITTLIFPPLKSSSMVHAPPPLVSTQPRTRPSRYNTSAVGVAGASPVIAGLAMVGAVEKVHVPVMVSLELADRAAAITFPMSPIRRTNRLIMQSYSHSRVKQ